ncbi:hypothetical protein [Desulfovibrio sp.]|uniref:hypothetical protein n=1 Tax=Desulfovibrio sp. TaxID=885 RepID=UPI0025BD9F68|nr:hypothetical protein [Desulfovibrio sp.]
MKKTLAKSLVSRKGCGIVPLAAGGRAARVQGTRAADCFVPQVAGQRAILRRARQKAARRSTLRQRDHAV